MTRALLARACVSAGAVVTGFAVCIALPVFGARAQSLATLLLGGALLAIGSWKTSGGTFSILRTLRQKWKWSIPCGLLVGTLVASRAIELRVDLTRSATNTLAAESVAVARGLPGPVRVVAFLEQGGRAAVELAALVERYTAVRRDITLELRSAERAVDLEEARTLGLADLLSLGGPNVAVVAATSPVRGPVRAPVRLRFDAGLVDGEEQLTNALVRATTTSAAQRVYVVAGHGEPDLRDDGPGGLSRLASALAPRGIEFVPLPLAAVGAVPDDARAVVLLPTTAPWAAGEDAALARFVDSGGAVLVLLEPPAEGAPTSPALSSLCARFGVDVLPDVVVDDSPFHALLGSADVVTGASQMAHAITRPLAGALTHFPRAVALGLSPLPTTSVVPLVSTGAEARADRVAARGPLPLVVAAEPGPSATTSTIPAAATPATGTRGRQRAVVAADATFVQNAAIGLGANRDLAQNIVLWLAEDDSHIVVHPHVRGGSLVFLTPSAREALAFVLLVVVPGLLAALGAAFTAVRRAR